ncbi:MAG TPA: hypothetical protein EYP21_02150 [Syntrophaceae bacterium]|nr:hypothetical protein [Syntrophaceae bacterium]
MRKFVIWALSLLFVVAMATYTLATEFKFGGSWTVRGIYWDTGVGVGSGTVDKDILEDVTYYDVRLRMDMCAKVTDKLSFHAQADSALGYPGDYERDNPLSTPDSYFGVWSGNALIGRTGQYSYRAEYGEYAPAERNPLGTAMAPLASANIGTGGNASTQRDIIFQRAYLKWATGLGTLKVGRQWAYWGHGLVEGMNRNRIEWEYEQPSYCIGFGLDKWAEGDLFLDEDDIDHYFLYAKITKPNFEFGPYFGYARNNQPDGALAPGSRADMNLYYTSWWLKYVMGNLSFSGEYVYKWGKSGYRLSQDLIQGIDQHGLVYDLTYNAGPCKIGYEQGYFTGPKDGASGAGVALQDEAFVTSYSFSPFLIVGEVLVNGLAMDGRLVTATNMNCNYVSNCHYWKGFIEASPTRNLSLTTQVGYIQANNKIETPTNQSRNRSMGTEWDIMGTYKLTDNLSYTAAWAYLWTGGFWETIPRTPLGVTAKADDAMVFLHQIAITF